MFWLSKNGRKWRHAIRKGHLKLIHEPISNTFEAYNLANDISESRNIINETWVAKQVPEMLGELTRIGPCPRSDTTGAFYIVKQGEQRDCAWFELNQTRCDEHIKGNLLCPSACPSRFGKACTKQQMYGSTVVSPEKDLEKPTLEPGQTGAGPNVKVVVPFVAASTYIDPICRCNSIVNRNQWRRGAKTWIVMCQY